LPLYNARRPVLIDFALKAGGDVERYYAQVQKDNDVLGAGIYLPDYKGGTYLWAKARPLYDARGDIAGAIETVHDYTVLKRAERALQRRIRLTDLVINISTRFISHDVREIDAAIDDALEQIGRISGVDRSYVFLKKEDGASYENTHEWCAEGVGSRKAQLQSVRMEDFPWAAEKVEKGEVVHVPRVSDLPPEAAKDRSGFQRQGIKSLISVPIVSGGVNIGFTGFDMMRREMAWPEEFVALLKIVADIFGNALDRKRAETALHRSQQQLRESARHYRQLMEAASDGIYLVDSTGAVLAANSKACEMLGYSREELLGKTIFELIDPEDRPDDPLRLDLLLEGVAIIEERRFLRSDGTALPVEISAKTVDENRIQAFVRDITERKRLETQIQQARKLESLGVLAGGIAHDFNSMLVSILSNAGLALMDLPEDSPAYESVRQIEKAALHARQLTSQMLAYSGRGKFVVASFDLSRAVEEIANVLRPTIPDGVSLECSFAEGLPPVEGDAMQIRQVVMNLISNAREAMQDSGGRIRVSTGVMDADEDYLAETYLADELPPGRYVFLEVSDNGCGMDEDVRTKIFDPFFSSKGPGRGLGLAGALGIVRGHRGAIKVASKRGEGTTFRVLLPTMDGGASEPSAERTITVAKPSRSGTILVVDDDASVRAVADKILRKFGFKVLQASNGREGVEVFKAHQNEVDVVLLDMTMPDADGEEVTRRIHDLSAAEVRIIFSSAFTEQYFTKSFANKKFVSFLQKPYRPDELVDKVHEALAS